MKFLLYLLLPFLLPFQLKADVARPLPAPHPFYVSVTEVTQNTAEKSLEISCKFFADDFEETLQSAFRMPLDIKSEKDKAAFDKFIPAYISQHLLLVADGKPLKLSYVGFEMEKESVYCYFEVSQVPAVKQVTIANTLLHDFKKEQINIMHVTANGNRHSTKLDYPASKAEFRF